LDERIHVNLQQCKVCSRHTKDPDLLTKQSLSAVAPLQRRKSAGAAEPCTTRKAAQGARREKEHPLAAGYHARGSALCSHGALGGTFFLWNNHQHFEHPRNPSSEQLRGHEVIKYIALEVWVWWCVVVVVVVGVGV
jgi:hypothetical protein